MEEKLREKLRKSLLHSKGIRASVTNYPYQVASNKTESLPSYSVGWKSDTGLTRLNSRYGQS
jgi:hypothetical protein